ncbi:hypothetical protein [Streptomyces qinglanensis]|uniref:hypothetical protein n=1 Tax=Streptomyces qinglanensis TaxID=943816 RepID=UPI003798CBC4
MSTKTTFQDRLLSELKDEIGKREALAVREAPQTREQRTRPTGPDRRLFTPLRVAGAGMACSAAAAAVVLTPGSPADSPAYALERLDDSRVSVTMGEIKPDRQAQQELADKLREYGITVSIDVLPPGYRCREPRGEAIDWTFVPEGKPVKAAGSQDGNRSVAQKGHFKITLEEGDTLLFENSESHSSTSHAFVFEDADSHSGTSPRSLAVGGIKGTASTCERVKSPETPTPPNTDKKAQTNIT